MRTELVFGKRRGSRTAALVGLLIVAAQLTASQAIATGTNVIVWDTGADFGNTIDLQNRTSWVAIPSEMFAFEKDPA